MPHLNLDVQQEKDPKAFGNHWEPISQPGNDHGNPHGSAEPRGETVLKGHVNVQKVCEREASCR